MLHAILSCALRKKSGYFYIIYDFRLLIHNSIALQSRAALFIQYPTICVFTPSSVLAISYPIRLIRTCWNFRHVYSLNIIIMDMMQPCLHHLRFSTVYIHNSAYSIILHKSHTALLIQPSACSNLLACFVQLS